MPIRLAFDVPAPHLADLASLGDFRVAHASVVMTDVKYREKVKPLDLLLADPMPLSELRRVVTLATPWHVTVHPPTDDTSVEAFLQQCNVAFDTELAVVVPVGESGLVKTAVDEEASVIALAPGPGRVEWLRGMSLPEGQWYHFLELSDAEELRAIVDLNLRHVSVHTDLPIRFGIGSSVPHDTKFSPEEVERVKGIIEAMKAVCR